MIRVRSGYSQLDRDSESGRRALCCNSNSASSRRDNDSAERGHAAFTSSAVCDRIAFASILSSKRGSCTELMKLVKRPQTGFGEIGARKDLLTDLGGRFFPDLPPAPRRSVTIPMHSCIAKGNSLSFRTYVSTASLETGLRIRLTCA